MPNGRKACVSTNITTNLVEYLSAPVPTNSNMIMYVPGEYKEKVSDYVSFTRTDYGLSDIYVDESWFRVMDVPYENCDVSNTDTNDPGYSITITTESKQSKIRIVYPKYYSISRNLDKMLFLMEWGFDEIE